MDFLFDIGKVLLDFDFERSLSKLLPPDKAHPQEAFDLLLEKKDDFEAGRIPVEEYIPWASQLIGFHGPQAEFEKAWQEIFTPNQPMWDLVKKLKSDGHRLILFSNTNAIHIPYVYETYPDFSLFDGAVLSFQVGAIKPETKIYEHAIETYQLTPEETLYIDDLPQNIAAGKDHGFDCWEYRLDQHEDMLKWLESKLST